MYKMMFTVPQTDQGNLIFIETLIKRSRYYVPTVVYYLSKLSNRTISLRYLHLCIYFSNVHVLSFAGYYSHACLPFTGA